MTIYTEMERTLANFMFYDKLKFVEKKTLFSTCIMIGEKIYSSTCNGNFLITVNVNESKLDYIHGLKKYRDFVADEMICDGDNIYILEVNGSRLMKYNIRGKNCEYLKIGCEGRGCDNYSVFAKYEKNIYIIPKYKDTIIKIDLDTGKRIENKRKYLSNNQNKYEENLNSNVCFEFGLQSDNLIWLFLCNDRLIVCYDMKLKKWEKYDMPLKMDDCIHGFKYEEKIYLLGSKGIIYCWDTKDYSFVIIADCRRDGSYFNEFGRIIIVNEIIYLLPALGKEILKIYLETGEKEIYHCYPKDFQYCAPQNWGKYYGYCENEEYYFIAMRSANYILVINKKTGKTSWIKPDMPSDRERFAIYREYKKLLNENDWSKEELIMYLYENDSSFLSSFNKTVGKHIWGEMNRK